MSRQPLGLVALAARITVVFLVLDAFLLAGAGVLTRRPTLLAGAALAVAASLGVLALQKRFSARWSEITAARHELKNEAAGLADGLRNSATPDKPADS